jgi:hypothetical protein
VTSVAAERSHFVDDLQDQGSSEDASRFAYHAQVLHREVYRRQRKVGAVVFSLLIATLSGYGCQ